MHACPGVGLPPSLAIAASAAAAGERVAVDAATPIGQDGFH